MWSLLSASLSPGTASTHLCSFLVYDFQALFVHNRQWDVCLCLIWRICSQLKIPMLLVYSYTVWSSPSCRLLLWNDTSSNLPQRFAFLINNDYLRDNYIKKYKRKLVFNLQAVLQLSLTGTSCTSWHGPHVFPVRIPRFHTVNSDARNSVTQADERDGIEPNWTDGVFVCILDNFPAVP